MLLFSDVMRSRFCRKGTHFHTFCNFFKPLLSLSGPRLRAKSAAIEEKKIAGKGLTITCSHQQFVVSVHQVGVNPRSDLTAKRTKPIHSHRCVDNLETSLNLWWTLSKAHCQEVTSAVWGGRGHPSHEV